MANLELGELMEVTQDHVITKKGVFDIDEFGLPKDLVERYDHECIWFKIEKKCGALQERHLTQILVVKARFYNSV